MRTIHKTLIVFAAMILSFSCEDMVDLDPQYTLDAENYFQSEDDYDNALTGAYDLLQTSYLTFWIGEIASDNSIAGGESVNDSQGLHQIDEMSHGATNSELRSILRYNYAGITRVNYMFEYKDNIDFDGKDVLFGQAYFLRAYYYSELVKYFGDIPLIIDERLGVEEVTNLDRTPVDEVYAQIESDLQAAAEALDWTAEQKGRITKGAALALLGKVYLYQDKFTEAAEVLDQVIEEGPYELIEVSTSEEYAALFSVDEEGNSESVFEIEYSGDEGGSYDCLVCLEGNAAVGYDGIRQYDGPEYSDGNSYNLPTEDLYDFFDDDDIRKDGTVLDLDAFIEAQYADGYDEEITYLVGGGGHTGYYNNKYIKRQDELGLADNDLTSPVNYRVIRYPDVLLMAAEAYNRMDSPNDTKAQGYLNQVRNRVGMSSISATGSTLTSAIWTERRLELSGEGLRFFDLVRTGQAADAIDGFVEGKHELFPIPQVEIDLAGGNWEQNPNY